MTVLIVALVIIVVAIAAFLWRVGGPVEGGRHKAGAPPAEDEAG